MQLGVSEDERETVSVIRTLHLRRVRKKHPPKGIISLKHGSVPIFIAFATRFPELSSSYIFNELFIIWSNKNSINQLSNPC